MTIHISGFTLLVIVSICVFGFAALLEKDDSGYASGCLKGLAIIAIIALWIGYAIARV